MDWKRGLRRVLYPGVRGAHAPPAGLGPAAPAHRHHARRQPSVGEGGRRRHRPGTPGGRGQASSRCSAGARRPGSRRHPVAALDRQPQPSRPRAAPLLQIIEEAVDSLADEQRWRLHPVGALDLLPAATAERLKAAAEATRDVEGIVVNIAVGYGGRREIADAVRALLHEQASKGMTLEELAEVIDVEHIAEHLYTKGQPDPDLVIRTSGSSGSAASCSGRARTASSTSARPTGRTSGAWTSCARCGLRPARASLRPDRDRLGPALSRDRRGRDSAVFGAQRAVHPPRSGVSFEKRRRRRTFPGNGKWGRLPVSGGSLVMIHDCTARQGYPCRADGGRHSGLRARSRSACVN